MQYEGSIYRPPSEAESLLLQVTIGCSHNKCTFCAMYGDKNFRIKPLAQVFADIDACVPFAAQIFKVFLCDGDALILPFLHLEAILQYINKKFPKVRRVSTYGDSIGILSKTIDELQKLQALGLTLIYEGVESGDSQTLLAINKRSSKPQMLEAAQYLRESNIKHSVMFLLGLGGVSRSREHAEQSAELLSQINPAYAAALTLTLIPDTPLGQLAQSKQFVLPDHFGLLSELFILISQAQVTQCLFSANHASNYLPVQGWLPKDKTKLLQALQTVIDSRDKSALKPEWMRGL